MLSVYKNGITSVVNRVKILDSTAAYPKGLTGLTSASSGLIISTIANNEAAPTAYTVAGGNVETISTLGTYAAPTSGKCRFKEVDATNHPGVYEIQIADARWAVSGARNVIVTLSGATNMVATDFLVQLVAVDLQDAVRGGLTALPNAAAEAAGGLFTRGTGAGQINQEDNGFVSVNLKAILRTTLTETSGQIAAAFKKLFDVASPVLTATSVNQTGDNFARLGAPAGVSTAADIAAIKAVVDLVKAKTDNLPADPADDSDIDGQLAVITGAVTTVAGLVAALNNLSQADVRTAVGLGSANLDTQLAAIAALIGGLNDTSVADIIAGIDVDGLDLQEALRIYLAALVGLADGATGPTMHFRDQADTKNRITATVDDDGNRTAVVLDAA